MEKECANALVREASANEKKRAFLIDVDGVNATWVHYLF